MTNRRTRTYACWLGLSAAAALSTLAPPAQAQSEPRAEASEELNEELKAARQKVFAEALAAMDRKDWAECRVKTLGAWAVRKHPQLASLAGICEVELGLFRDAAEHLHYALEHGEGEVAIRGEQVKAAHAKALAKVGTVVLSSPHEGVELRVGGQPAGTAPATIFVEPGEHTIEARLAGYDPRTEKLTLAAGDKRELQLELTASKLPFQDRPPRDDEPRAKRPLWPAFVLGGVAAAGVGLGITGVVVAGGARGDAEDAIAAAGPGGCGADGSGCASVQDSLDQQDTFRGLGIGGFALGGAALAGMVVYLVLPESAEQGTGLRLTPMFGTTNGLSLGGTF